MGKYLKRVNRTFEHRDRIIFYPKLYIEPPLGFEFDLVPETQLFLRAKKEISGEIFLFLDVEAPPLDFFQTFPFEMMPGGIPKLESGGNLIFPNGKRILVGNTQKLVSKILRDVRISFSYEACPGEIWVYLEDKGGDYLGVTKFSRDELSAIQKHEEGIRCTS